MDGPQSSRAVYEWGVIHDVEETETGQDELYGGGGQNHLFGGDSDDVLDGGREADHLQGEAGSDRVYGGAGRDHPRQTQKTESRVPNCAASSGQSPGILGPRDRHQILPAVHGHAVTIWTYKINKLRVQ